MDSYHKDLGAIIEVTICPRLLRAVPVYAQCPNVIIASDPFPFLSVLV